MSENQIVISNIRIERVEGEAHEAEIRADFAFSNWKGTSLGLGTKSLFRLYEIYGQHSKALLDDCLDFICRALKPDDELTALRAEVSRLTAALARFETENLMLRDALKSDTHRDVQTCERLAGELRKVVNYLANSHRAREDAVALNAQLVTLSEAAIVLKAGRPWFTFALNFGRERLAGREGG